jgi:hypothetical protein
MLLSNILQSQTWTNYQSLIAYSGFDTEAFAQKVKVFNQDTLIGITKKIGIDHYGFTMFQNGNSTQYVTLLDTPDIIISDVTFLDDTAYFCGKRLTSQNTYVGVIGRFSVRDFINNGSFSYELTDIIQVENLIGLVAYYKPQSTVVFLKAIGNTSLSAQSPGRVIQLDFYNNTPNILHYFVHFFPVNYVLKEIMHDICLTDNYIVTVSHIYPQNRYVVRTFDRQNPLNELMSTEYNFTNNVAFNVASDHFLFPIHITHLINDRLAISLSATDGQNFFTMVNYTAALSSNISHTHLIYHYDKSNRALEMEYSASTGILLALTETNFFSQGANQRMFYLKPFHTNTYNANVEKLSVNSQLNHFCVLPNDRYATVGVYRFSQTNDLHLYAIKDINANGLMCIPDTPETIGIGVSLNGNQTTPLVPQNFPNILSWSINTATYNGIIITTECTN